VAYSNEAITALAQLAQATGGLHDRLSKESDDARAIAGEMITAANAAKLQAAMRIGEMKMTQKAELTKESITALKGITASRIEAGTFESSALESIEEAMDEGDSLSYFGSANFGDARNVRKNFIEYIDTVDESIKTNKLGYSDILTKKEWLGKDSTIVKGTVGELKALKSNLEGAISGVEQTQQFGKDLPETYLAKGKRPRTALGIFTETEEEAMKRADKQIKLIDSLINQLEK